MIRGAAYAASALIVALFAHAWSSHLASHLLIALYLLFLWFGRRSRRRTFLFCIMILGLFVSQNHYVQFGSSPIQRSRAEKAGEKLKALLEETATALGEQQIPEGTGPSLPDIVKDRLDESTSIVITDLEGHPVLWSGRTDAGNLPLRQGYWISLDRKGSHVLGMHDTGAYHIHARKLINVETSVDSLVTLSDWTYPSLPLEKIRPMGNRIIFALALILFLFLIAELYVSGSVWISVLLLLFWRIAFQIAHGAEVLFGATGFASPYVFARSSGDLLISGIVIFLLLSIIIPKREDISRMQLLIWSSTVLFIALFSLLYLRWTDWVNGYVVSAELQTHHVILQTPVVVLLAALVTMYLSCARLIHILPDLRCKLFWATALGWAVCGAIWGEWGYTGLGILLVSRMWRKRAVWPVLKWTAITLITVIVLSPKWDSSLRSLRKSKVEDLAEQISSSGTQWFKLLVDEAANAGMGCNSSYEIWRNGPLSDLPVTGEIVSFDSEGSLRDRFNFGSALRRRQPDPSTLVRETISDIWIDAAAEISPPMNTVNILVPVDTMSVYRLSLMADMTAPLFAGTGMLADGSPWPEDARLHDRGLISALQPEDHTLGWTNHHRKESELYNFQREYADGPHLLTIMLINETSGDRIISLLALLGMGALLAQISIASRNIWLCTSISSLFFRYRDRFLPFLLAIAVPPLLAILAFGPWIDRQVRTGESIADLDVRLDEITDRFRSGSFEQAAHAAAIATARPDDNDYFSPRGDRATYISNEEINERDSQPPVAGMSMAMLRSVSRSRRDVMVAHPDGNSLVIAVPAEDGIVVVRRPLFVVAEMLAQRTPDISVGIWRSGVLVAVSLHAPCDDAPQLLPASSFNRLKIDRRSPVYHRSGWNFKAVSDDIREDALVVGIRREHRAPRRLLSDTTNLWGLGIILPVLVLIVFLSSVAARLFTSPVSNLASLAHRVETEGSPPEWPVLGGELGQLTRALESMTSRLVSSRMDADRRRMYLQAVLEQITSAVIVVASDGRVDLTNHSAEEILPWLSDEGGNTLLDGPMGDSLNRVLSTRKSLEETIVFEQDGILRKWQVGIAVLGGPLHNDLMLGAVIVLEEITELAERERLLAWAEFAREMAHEVKNPLTPMKLAAQHLRKAGAQRGPAFDTALRRATEMIERQANRIEEIVDEFATFSRATGKEFREVELSGLVRECVEDYRYAIEEGVALNYLGTDVELVIMGDREALLKVVVNLVDNALRAVGAEGTISVGIEENAGEAVISCRDSGSGIPKDFLSRVFEPGITSRSGGTGLGLSICRSIVTAHGGKIRIAESDSRGTEVLVELPLLRSGTGKKDIDV